MVDSPFLKFLVLCSFNSPFHITNISAYIKLNQLLKFNTPYFKFLITLSIPDEHFYDSSIEIMTKIIPYKHSPIFLLLPSDRISALYFFIT